MAASLEVVTPDGTPVPGDDPDITPVGFDAPLSTDEAQALTDQIKTTANVLYVLIRRAHAGKAHKALGYNSFEEYVRAEFDIGRSRAYQLLDQAKVIEAIEEVLPDGVKVEISEAAARDLKHVLEDVVPEIKAAAASAGDLDQGQAQSLVNNVIDQHRAERADERAEKGDRPDGPYDGPYEGRGRDDDAGYGPEADVDANQVRQEIMRIFDARTAVSALSKLSEVSDVDAFIDAIPPDTHIVFRTHLGAANEWLDEFVQAYFKRFPPTEHGEES